MESADERALGNSLAALIGPNSVSRRHCRHRRHRGRRNRRRRSRFCRRRRHCRHLRASAGAPCCRRAEIYIIAIRLPGFQAALRPPLRQCAFHPKRRRRRRPNVLSSRLGRPSAIFELDVNNDCANSQLGGVSNLHSVARRTVSRASERSSKPAGRPTVGLSVCATVCRRRQCDGNAGDLPAWRSLVGRRKPRERVVVATHNERACMLQ